MQAQFLLLSTKLFFIYFYSYFNASTGSEFAAK